jgi:hypothetical protein
VSTTDSDTAPEPDLGDQELLQELATLRADTAPPPSVAALARQAFALRLLDAELAVLVFDSDDDIVASGTDRELLAVRRAAPGNERRLVFESAGERLALELTLTKSGQRHRLEGHVLPTGAVTIEIRSGAAGTATPVDADLLGGFVVEGLEPGPIRVTCRREGEGPVSSEWLMLD